MMETIIDIALKAGFVILIVFIAAIIMSKNKGGKK